MNSSDDFDMFDDYAGAELYSIFRRNIRELDTTKVGPSWGALDPIKRKAWVLTAKDHRHTIEYPS